MTQTILSTIPIQVREAGKYRVIADGTKDVSKNEQISIALKYFHNCIVHE